MPKKTTRKGTPVNAVGTDVKAVRLELPESEHIALRVAAAKRGQSMAALVREMVQAFLARERGGKS
jgi:plasmid stability protein